MAKNPLMLDGMGLYSGTAATRAAALAAMPADAPVGSIFVGQSAVATTKPNLYVKVSATACERIVSQASD